MNKCKICNSNNVEIRGLERNQHLSPDCKYYAICRDCGASSKLTYSKEEALILMKRK